MHKIVVNCFPSGSQIAENINEVAPEERFWLIPGRNGPRWLIPQDRRYGAAVLKQWRPYGLFSQAKWEILYRAYCSGLLGSVPKIVSVGVAGFMSQQWGHLGWDGDPPVPIVYIGTRGLTQKAVLSLVDQHSQATNLVAKVPLGDNASKSILHEFDVLASLAEENLGLAPRPYFVNRELGIASQEALSGRLVKRRYSVRLNEYLSSLKTSHTITIRKKSDILYEKLLGMCNINARIKIFLTNVLNSIKNDTEILAVHVHGDFVPWNILEEKSGKIIPMDWELANLYGLPLYDYFYYHFQQSYLFKQHVSTSIPPGDLAKDLPKQIIEEIRKYTLVAMALDTISSGKDATYFLEKLGRAA